VGGGARLAHPAGPRASPIFRSETDVTTGDTEVPDDFLGRLLATRREIYGLLLDLSASNVPIGSISARLLDAGVRLDDCILGAIDRQVLVENHTAEVSRLAAERDAAQVRFVTANEPALMHAALYARMAPPVIQEPDPDDERSRDTVRRVVDAYHRARASTQAPSPSMWDVIEGWNQEFLAAVRDRDLETVQENLSRMFHTNLIWGLGRVHATMPTDLRVWPERSGPQIHLTDALVSLAEATGAKQITNLEQQGIETHMRALDVEIDRLLLGIEQRTGLDVSFSKVGGSYGGQVAGRFVTIDSLVHSYVVYRLLQIGAVRSDKIVEIGGGYGALASMFGRNGFTDYTIVDLPWVNLLQGYFLIMGLPPGTVSLFGEPERSIKVLPFWTFGEYPDRSVDYVVNTDSLPEIGAETALQYLRDIARIVRKRFVSINQEAKALHEGVGHENCVTELAATSGGLDLLHRNRAWMRQGYVEEIYAPKPSAAPSVGAGAAEPEPVSGS
jgi:hypothetical protein